MTWLFDVQSAEPVSRCLALQIAAQADLDSDCMHIHECVPASVSAIAKMQHKLLLTMLKQMTVITDQQVGRAEAHAWSYSSQIPIAVSCRLNARHRADSR